jgi:hypothetical protein
VSAVEMNNMTIGVVVISAVWHIPGARTLINPLKVGAFSAFKQMRVRNELAEFSCSRSDGMSYVIWLL